MCEQIEVIYENGVLRPLAALPSRFREHQHFVVTIEGVGGADDWLADADPTVRLEDVRQILAKVKTTFACAVHDEREER
jgi:predicted DNA-binding antitoxin AbrB/MazE fold protein